jgi:hypothetical protein
MVALRAGFHSMHYAIMIIERCTLSIEYCRFPVTGAS